MISQIMTDFPTKYQEYPASTASKLLDNLSMYFLTLPVESLAMEVSRDISRHRGFIEGALPALYALSTMKFASAGSFEDETDFLDVESDDGFIKKKVPQKMRKRNRQKIHTAIDTSPFVRLGVVVPLTGEAAASLSTYILTELKKALSVSIFATFLTFSLTAPVSFTSRFCGGRNWQATSKPYSSQRWKSLPKMLRLKFRQSRMSRAQQTDPMHTQWFNP
jgi:hypothetical protein